MRSKSRGRQTELRLGIGSVDENQSQASTEVTFCSATQPDTQASAHSVIPSVGHNQWWCPNCGRYFLPEVRND